MDEGKEACWYGLGFYTHHHPEPTEYVEVVHPGAAGRLEDVAPGDTVAGRDEKFPRIRRILPDDPMLGAHIPQHHAPLVKVHLGGGIHLVRVLVDGVQRGVVRCPSRTRRWRLRFLPLVVVRSRVQQRRKLPAVFAVPASFVGCMMLLSFAIPVRRIELAATVDLRSDAA